MSITENERTPATPEQIWEILGRVAKLDEEMRERMKEADRQTQEIREQMRETDRLLKENAAQMKETDRQMKETDRQMKETDRQTKETREQMKETDRRVNENAVQMKETDRRLRRAEDLFTTQWGKLIESLVEGDLAPLLQARGVEVDAIVPGLKLRRDPKQREVDLLAINGEASVAVEVKTTLRPPDVDEFLELMRDLPNVIPKFFRGRFYGAVAYLREHEGTARYAARKGLFVIRATGSSASIVNPPEFRPRVFEAPTP